MKKNILFLFFFSIFQCFGQKYNFNTESKWFLNEYNGKGEQILGSESTVKTTLTLHTNQKLIFIERNIYDDIGNYLKTKVNQYNIIEILERDNDFLFKTADLLYRQYVEITLAKDTSYLSVSTKCDSKNCSEFNIYY